MRIKRFTAPDMRTALRMIRDEQGPDAVILSNRVCAGGIEVVAATDYDEALVAQALRAAAPALDAAPASVTAMSAPVASRAALHEAPAASTAVPALASLLAPAATAQAAREAAATQTQPAGETPPARESLMSRARAVFKIGDGPTLAELSAASAGSAQPGNAAAASTPAPAPSPVPAANTASNADATPAQTRFEAMMAALVPPQAATASHDQESSRSGLVMPNAAGQPASPASSDSSEPIAASAFATASAAAATGMESQAPGMDLSTIEAGIDASTSKATTSGTTPRLHAVPSEPAQSDPTIAAMREELARMRQMMESQMEQLSLERLRGSPARAAVFDALRGYGCEDTLAQAVSARIDPRLPVADIREPMFAELARMLTIARSEPLDDGGVIALVGPTGAGKTTTAAKLAARFAARHRARDVALVTTDTQRAGAREQLHAHGRRLGITVCEAAGPEGLKDALAQLTDYPLVLVDTTGHAPRDRALFSQILWLRASHKVRSLLVLPANAHPHDLGEVVRRYRPAAPEAVVLTKLDETGRLGSALSVAVRHGLNIAYTTQGQQVPSDLDSASAERLVQTLENPPRAADHPHATEDRHAAV
jgi:flagellar biosynthesis protein FlhF